MERYNEEIEKNRRERGEAQSDSKTKINNTGVEQWMVALVIGFFIIIGSFAGLFFLPSHIAQLKEEYDIASDNWINYLLEDNEQLEEEWNEKMHSIRRDIESKQAVLGALPFTILLGAIIMFLGLIGKYYTTKDALNSTKKENIKDENSKEILNKRYAKGEITKEEFEQIKKDIES